MKLNKMNKLLTILVPAIAMAASQPASAMSPTCATVASSILQNGPLLQAASISSTGTSFIVFAMYQFGRGGSSGHMSGIGEGFLRIGSSVMGTATISLGGIVGLVSSLLSENTPIENQDQIDLTRQYRGTQEYRCIRADLGRARTEELLSDAFAGWSLDSLARKYLSAQELDQYLALVNTSETQCSEETMSCGG